ncbi:MAG TPA: sigma-54 dependent transcriptional regulator [Longimicrobiaceae bacterium]|nr:sigma-54 dependent transcriptional regulator [Longimicrobiaceae bacterium]
MSDSSEQITILLVEDDDSFRRALVEVLIAHDYNVVPSPDARTALELLQSETIDAVVTDLVMPGMRGEVFLAEAAETFPEVPVIAITAFGSVESALAVTRAGAADYLVKPFRTNDLLSALRQVLEKSAAARQQLSVRRSLTDHVSGLVGTSPSMLEVFNRIGRVSMSPAPVLITGETGTGKELVARAVHDASGRHPFVVVNCGAMPEHLLESELFGHAKGAFTGAAREKPGLFEAASGGTFFLDEVGELPLPLQPKLLRVIEAGEVRRVGEVETRPVDIRIVSATHRDLEAAVADSTFREDLFWRLNVLHVEVPPLRQRPTDIPLLVESFLKSFAARRGGRVLTVSPGAITALAEHSWPGNVRQLYNTLERAVAYMDGNVIDLTDLPPEMQRAGRTGALVRSAADRELHLSELEREYILEVLSRADGNKTRAAELLGIPRRTLYRRLSDYQTGNENA